MVRAMRERRCYVAEIALAVGVSIPTLRKAFAAELAAASAARTLFDLDAIPPAPRAPAEPANPGGRPAHQPTLEDRRKVDLLIATGAAVAEIARVMGLSEPTLRRHFAAELETGAVRKRAETLMALDKAARAGNVTAQRTLIDMIDKAMLEALEREFRGGRQDRPGQENAADDMPVGKKVQAARDAASVMNGDDEWSTLLRPVH